MNSIYDNEVFFAEYAKMARSEMGLAGAGEWHQLKPMFPELKGVAVLDLGCGYGWHCGYAAECGAAHVLGIDLSEKMIAEAKKRNPNPKIQYEVCGLEEYDYPKDTYDCVVSNLVLHYIEDLNGIYRKVFQTLKSGGVFLFNIEHPTFTGGVNQSWICGQDDAPLYWPVDNYFYSGERETIFLGQKVKKQHHTLTQILGGLLETGFVIEAVEEAMPPVEMMDMPGMKDEMRRPMMLLVRVRKPAAFFGRQHI